MITVLVLAANPAATGALSLDEEIREIQTRIRQSQHRDVLRIEARLAARPKDIIQAVLELKPDIIHFCGHGSNTGDLIFHDDAGGVSPVSPSGLAMLMRSVQNHVRLVFLNACYSAQQAEIIGDEIDFVVGMTDAVGDHAAIEFAASFYQALGFGRTVTECFELARASLVLNGINEEDTPKLLAKNDASPGSVTLVGPEADVASPRVVEGPLVIVDKAESAVGSLRYRLIRDGSNLRIEPQDQYLDDVRSQAEISELSFWWSPWRLKFALPALDVKLVNNTDKTVFFHRATFKVRESLPDLRPIPVFWAQNYDGKLAFGNLGWGEMLNSVIVFGLGEHRDSEVPKPYRMAIDGAPESGYQTYNLADFVDGPELEYEYPEEVAYLIGDLEYDYVTAQDSLEHVNIPVRVAVRLGAQRRGLPRPPSYYYDVAFRAQGVDYEVEIPISHSLIPGEADRFQVSVGSTSPGTHEFKLVLHYDDDRIVESGWITLDIFMSQSEARAVRPRQNPNGQPGV